jgi:hypothetical protein
MTICAAKAERTDGAGACRPDTRSRRATDAGAIIGSSGAGDAVGTGDAA